MENSVVEVVIGVFGAIATIAAVVITHALNQKAGEKRADQVREELLSRIDVIGLRVGELKTDLSQRVADLKSDMVIQTSQIRSDLATQAAQGVQMRADLTQIRAEMTQLRSEIDRSADRTKEAMISELRALKAELLGGMNRRVLSAGDAA